MVREKKRKPGFLWGLSIQAKLLMVFALTAVLMFVINILLYGEINRSMKKLDEVYATNVSLNALTECLDETHNDVLEYLNTKSSDSLENYYRNVQEYQDMLEQLNGSVVDNERKILEKNIRSMSETYLELADETIQAKRGRNVERYKAAFAEESMKYQYIQYAIYGLNNLQFQNNSDNYQIMLNSLGYMEIISSIVVIAVAVINLLILILLIRTITEPLRMLAKSANEVAAGNFDISLPDYNSGDEVGVVTRAFAKMIESIREYIDKLRESMEKEQEMKEKELMMETHLKDAQLKYLQAQINPHFLFNSLNAGAQLAMMEDAEKTSIFVEKMADFFRYNVHKIEKTATLAEEIEAVDNYVYILNVRFAGDIHFEKEIAAGVEDVQLPSMILQPLVENAVNHGIRGVEWEGYIWLKVKRTESGGLLISIRDNGQGMTQERIREVMEGKVREKKELKDSTGIGMDNVISRLELFFGRKNLLQIYSDGPGKGTEIDILIPPEENKMR
ncbi:MAG: histidine kinase [Lachnospiraceae bacterium]|nr:histidine kinase [Lachnospiraceae bacterium]